MSVRNAANQFVVQHRLVQRPLAALARLRLSAGRVRPGATMIIVNWNSVDFLKSTLDAVERYSPPVTTDILVVDNDSHDGSRATLSVAPGAVRASGGNPCHFCPSADKR